MKEFKKQSIVRIKAFTLIEMLTVIGIIAILAALIVPAAHIAAAKARINRAHAELSQIETAIESYKSARGHYPPDNPNATNTAVNQLFYELTGTVYEENPPDTFYRIHGVEKISKTEVKNYFGVEGFVNASYVKPRNDPSQLQQAEARDFFPNIKPGQYFTNSASVAFFSMPIDGPDDIVTPDGRKVNPWHYNSSNPTNNPSSYDLWIDLVLRNRTHRICNWSDTPLIVN